jgi:hypothetical protein
MNNITLADGKEIPWDDSHKELKEDGQQRGYVVLSEEERAKGFVRPVRRSYVHVGITGPEFPLEDHDNAGMHSSGYVKFERYPKGYRGSSIGRYWKQEELDSIGKGCGTRTTMSQSIAETYAREPGFYGATYCCGCRAHFPVGRRGEFVWDGTDERVGT